MARNSKIQSTPDRSFEPSREKEDSSSYREFELSRVKLYRKRSEGKCKLLRVSGRFEFELQRARVTEILL